MYLLIVNFVSFDFFPVGRNGMPCQLMVGFFAYAKTFEIFVDKVELEGIVGSKSFHLFTNIALHFFIIIIIIIF